LHGPPAKWIPGLCLVIFVFFFCLDQRQQMPPPCFSAYMFSWRWSMVLQRLTTSNSSKQSWCRSTGGWSPDTTEVLLKKSIYALKLSDSLIPMNSIDVVACFMAQVRSPTSSCLLPASSEPLIEIFCLHRWTWRLKFHARRQTPAPKQFNRNLLHALGGQFE
jgi:hypothetical protein